MQDVGESVEIWHRESGRERSRLASEVRPVADDVTVLIPTLGRPILREALRSLVEGAVRPARLIVVHQGEDPAVREWIAEISDELTVEYVSSRTLGVSAARNLGFERVETRFVAVTDDDCIVRYDWVHRLAERLRGEPNRLVTGRVEPVGNQNIVITSTELDVQDRPRLRNDILSGGNMAGAIDVFRQIGPFDEDPCVAHAEDKEYAYRALRAGYSIVYDPSVVVGHVAWRNESRRADQYDGYARSHAAFFGKYLRRGDAFMVPRILVHLLRSSKRWLGGVLRDDAERADYGRAYLRWFFPGFIAGWRSGR